MSEVMTSELLDFLQSRAWVAKVSTTRKNGRPWVQPVWFIVDGDQIVFCLSRDSLLGRAVRRDPRLAVCVDDTEVPYAFATLEGTVQIAEGAQDHTLWQERLIRRYRDDVPDPAAHARMLVRDYGGLLTRFTPHKAYFEPVVAPPPHQDDNDTDQATVSTDPGSAS